MLSTFFRAPKPLLYIVVVGGAAIVAFCYYLRFENILACQAVGYGTDRYLASCRSDGYGEYDHGALWFELEPDAIEFARRAKVLFLGNSRMQLAFSTRATEDWFGSQPAMYYLLGFSESEKYVFEEQLLNKIKPQAGAYVINIDRFFEASESGPAQFVMHNSGALLRIKNKRLWQQIHKPVCSALPALCGQEFAVFRSRQTGAWIHEGGVLGEGVLTSEDPEIDQELVQQSAALGADFLLRLPVRPECVILTMVPAVKTQHETGSAIASALNRDFVVPHVAGLRTFDGSHLTPESAELWSHAFFQAAGPHIEKCLSEPNGFER